METKHRNKSLLIFTDKYPYGSGESFFEEELQILSDVFEEITILPLEKANNSKRRSLPAKVMLIEPPFNSIKNKMELLHQGIFNSSNVFLFLKEFFKSKVFLSPNKLRNWFTSFLLIRAELAFLKAKNINPDEYDLSYFYWGLRWSQVLPFAEIKNSKIIVRFHGSDLYDERNSNYIPFRKEQLRKINLAVFVSEMGKNYLENRYSHSLQKSYVSRLGTKDFGLRSYNAGTSLHIVSCSNIIALKQIDLLAKSLRYLNVRVKWTHIGDGSLKSSIMEIVANLDKNVETCFKGQLNHDELMLFYKQVQVDIFINTSLSEGVPVSVMEALSFGIPVIATDVGGTREIVDEEVGYLISPTISPEELAKKMEYLSGSRNYMQLRQNSRNRWEQRCRGEVLFSEFARMLKHF